MISVNPSIMRWKDSHIQIGVELCKKYKESATVINAVESHHGDVEPTSLIACICTGSRYYFGCKTGRETRDTGDLYQQIKTTGRYCELL